MNYGLLIKRLRKEKNMNMRDFAKLVGISFQYVSCLENEKANSKGQPLNPSIDILKQICDRCNYSFRQFLEEAGYIEPSAELQKLCLQLDKAQEEKVIKYINSILN